MKHAVLRALLLGLIRFGRGAARVSTFLVHAMRVITQPLVFLTRLSGPLLTRIYLLIRTLKRTPAPHTYSEDRVFFVFSHRASTHTFLLIVAGVGIFAGIHAAQSSSLTSGRGTLLFQIFSDDWKDQESISGLPPAINNFTSRSVTAGTLRPISRVENTQTNSSLLVVGEGSVLQPPPATTERLRTRTTIESYIVQSGDTLSTIAEKFGISVNTILWENNLSPYQTIRPGQSLSILPQSGIRYTIRRGDTLQKIAAAYGSSEEQIRASNEGAVTNSLVVGTKIFIPGGKQVANTTPRAPSVARNPTPSQPSTADRSLAQPASSLSGTYIWPTVGRRVSQYFSFRHPALDIPGKLGIDPIYAAADGEVIKVEYGRTDYGYQVMIEHPNGSRTRYAHASKIFVKVGDQVKQGDVIAMIGSTGRSTGPHTHFELFINGSRVNPIPYLTK